ncbi:MAG: hypothetical protein IJG63_00830, partial [Oscillospiraceae bacterium]|nr:hypothetical protein [Oscillospiraceae bacterium]
AHKGDNVGIWISEDGTVRAPHGAALVNRGSELRGLVGNFVGTVELNDVRRTALTVGDRFQLKYPGYDVTATIGNTNGGDLQPGTAREGVIMTVVHPVTWYVGQQLTIMAGGQTYGTFTITEINAAVG